MDEQCKAELQVFHIVLPDYTSTIQKRRISARCTQGSKMVTLKQIYQVTVSFMEIFYNPCVHFY